MITIKKHIATGAVITHKIVNIFDVDFSECRSAEREFDDEESK